MEFKVGGMLPSWGLRGVVLEEVSGVAREGGT